MRPMEARRRGAGLRKCLYDRCEYCEGETDIGFDGPSFRVSGGKGLASSRTEARDKGPQSPRPDTPAKRMDPEAFAYSLGIRWIRWRWKLEKEKAERMEWSVQR